MRATGRRAHLLPKGCCCAVAPRRTLCRATAAAAPRPFTTVASILPQPIRARDEHAGPRRRQRRGHRRSSGARGNEARSRPHGRGPRGPRVASSARTRPARREDIDDPAPDHERQDLAAFASTVWTWTGTPIPRGAARARRGLGYSFSCGPSRRPSREHDTEKLKRFDDFDVAADTVNDGGYSVDSLVAEARRRLRKTIHRRRKLPLSKMTNGPAQHLRNARRSVPPGHLGQRLTDLLRGTPGHQMPLYGYLHMSK